METPKVSIVIPVKIDSPYKKQLFRKLLDSVVFQSVYYPNLEIIVVDDNSEEQFRDFIISEVDAIESTMSKMQLGEIRLLKYGNDMGITKAIQTGFEHATGEYIARIDADDMLLDASIFNRVRYLQNNPHIDFVYTSWFLNQDSKMHFNQVHPFNKGKMLFDANFINGQTVMFKRKCLELTGGNDLEMKRCSDWDLWIRMMLKGVKFGCLDTPTAVFRIHSENVTVTHPEEGQKYVNLIKSKYLEQRETFVYGGLDK